MENKEVEIVTENINNVEVETKKKKTPKEMTLFILKIVGNVLFYCVILFLLLFSIMNIRGGSTDSKNIPNLFNKGFLTVADTKSMEAPVKEGKKYVYADKNYSIKTFGSSDLLNVDVVSFTKDTNLNDYLKVGDVIIFYDNDIQTSSGATIKGKVAHRIIEITSNGVICMGDTKAQELYEANVVPYVDATPEFKYSYYEKGGLIQPILAEDILGVVTSVSYGAGSFMNWIRTYWLFVFIIPVAIILCVEIFFVVKNILDLRGTKQKEALEADKADFEAQKEALKEEMRKQLLAEMAKEAEAQASAENKVDEDTTNKVEDESTQDEQVAENVDSKATDEPKEE